MQPKQNLPHDVILAIEACRPDSDDASLAEVASILKDERPARVAELRRSVQRVDRAIMAAAQKLPVPEGLADRILANLHSAPLDAPTRWVGCETRAEEAEMADDAPRRHVRRASKAVKGRWMAAGAGLAMAASLLIAATLWLARGAIDVAQVQAAARTFYEADDHRAELSTSEFPTTVPALAANTIAGWRHARFLNRDGVAYELTRRGVRGTLYVVGLRSFWGPQLNDLPPMPVPHGTAGMTVAVWADDGYAYVMVVKGGEREFRSLFSRNVV